MTLKVDSEFLNLIPQAREDEMEKLEASIKSDGCRDALVLWGETIVDGHNRYDICHRNRIPFDVVQKEFSSKDEAKAWILRNQLGRRNLTDYDRTRLALQLKRVLETEARERQKRKSDFVRQNSDEQKTRTDEEVGSLAGVSRDTVRKVEKIEQQADEETRQKLSSGDMSINKAYQAATQASEPQEKRNGKTPPQKAQDNFSKLLKNLYELSAGVDQAGGLRTIVRSWPEQDQRVFVKDYRSLGERVIRQTDEFQSQQKGGE